MACPPGKILNPESGRYVKIDGKIGKMVLEAQSKHAAEPEVPLKKRATKAKAPALPDDFKVVKERKRLKKAKYDPDPKYDLILADTGYTSRIIKRNMLPELNAQTGKKERVAFIYDNLWGTGPYETGDPEWPAERIQKLMTAINQDKSSGVVAFRAKKRGEKLVDDTYVYTLKHLRYCNMTYVGYQPRDDDDMHGITGKYITVTAGGDTLNIAYYDFDTESG